MTTTLNNFTKHVTSDENWSKLSKTMASAGRDYSHHVSRQMLELSPDLDSSSVILDNGCGPATLTVELLDLFQERGIVPKHVHAVDFSKGMIEIVSDMKEKNPTKFGLIETAVMDAQSLKFPDSTFTHSYMTFVLFAVPDAQLAAHEIYRTLKPGGIAGIALHKTFGWRNVVHRVQKKLHPELPLWELPMDSSWNDAGKATELLVKAGFDEGNIKVTPFEGRAAVDAMLKMFKSPMCDDLYNGWTETEKAEFDMTFVDCLTDEQANRGIEMSAWITIAQKQ